MARIARKKLDTSFLHIMVQGVNKEYIFNKENIFELISNKDELRDLVFYLKKVGGFTYIEIQHFFDISTSNMIILKNKKKSC